MRRAREVRDTSLRVPHGETGTVIAVKEITREDAEEDGDELPNGVNQTDSRLHRTAP